MTPRKKTKIALDENRMSILGVQMLFGFQLQAPFQAMFAELREGVEEHVGMEEDELMPAVAAALGRELERLGQQLEERRGQLMAGKA